MIVIYLLNILWFCTVIRIEMIYFVEMFDSWSEQLLYCICFDINKIWNCFFFFLLSANRKICICSFYYRFTTTWTYVTFYIQGWDVLATHRTYSHSNPCSNTHCHALSHFALFCKNLIWLTWVTTKRYLQMQPVGGNGSSWKPCSFKGPCVLPKSWNPFILHGRTASKGKPMWFVWHYPLLHFPESLYTKGSTVFIKHLLRECQKYL